VKWIRIWKCDGLERLWKRTYVKKICKTIQNPFVLLVLYEEWAIQGWFTQSLLNSCCRKFRSCKIVYIKMYKNLFQKYWNLTRFPLFSNFGYTTPLCVGKRYLPLKYLHSVAHILKKSLNPWCQCIVCLSIHALILYRRLILKSF